MTLNPVIATLGRRLRLAVIGGGPGSFIGAMHRHAARLDDRFEIKEQEEDEERRYVSIQIAEGHQSKELLQALVPKINIHSFNEILPTMNDIFISVVKENEGK